MNQNRQKQLSRIVIKGFKSIKECELELRNINVFIGSNGAGKSNFISVIELLQSIVSGRLSNYAAKKGANLLFFNCPKVTDSITVEFYFDEYIYSFELEMTDNNSLFIAGESVGQINSPIYAGGYSESKLNEWCNDPKTSSDAVRTVLDGHWRTYHFHDTSPYAKIKSAHNVSNAVFLHKDAGNLAAFLYRMKEFYPAEYNNILKAVQMIAPFFDDFMLVPEEGNKELIVLRWLKKDCDDVFNAAQFSDGTLRFICLAALLLQPTKFQPATIIIDEPELGLHPFAISILAEMMQKAAVNKQIIVATQSVELLDCFSVDDVIVADSDEEGSQFRRLEREQIKYWLENEYSLGELWNKNVLGGRFSR
jgi:predicted ATPase